VPRQNSTTAGWQSLVITQSLAPNSWQNRLTAASITRCHSASVTKKIQRSVWYTQTVSGPNVTEKSEGNSRHTSSEGSAGLCSSLCSWSAKDRQKASWLA
jgi:hypothetical protein